MLFIPCIGFDQTLLTVRRNSSRTKLRTMAYPCIVEFGLYSDKFAFLLVLCSKDLQLGRFERAISWLTVDELDRKWVLRQ